MLVSNPEHVDSNEIFLTAAVISDTNSTEERPNSAEELDEILSNDLLKVTKNLDLRINKSIKMPEIPSAKNKER